MESRSGFYRSLYFQVLLGVAAGIVAGYFWPKFGASLKPLGDGFVKIVKMMIAPIVFCTMALGVATINDVNAVGKSLLKALGLFYVLTAFALAIGLVSVHLFEPGAGMNINPVLLDQSVVARYSETNALRGVVDLVLHVIPRSFVGALAEGEVLPVLLLAILVGFGLARSGREGDALRQAIASLSQVLFTMFGFLMKLAPLGAFGAMAVTVGTYGVKSISSLGLLIAAFYAACLFFAFFVLGALAWLNGFSLWQLLRYFKEELLVVLGTSSTESVPPRMLMKLESLGCNKRVSGLVLPLGYAFNLDGTAIYLTLASVFIAQACNIHLSLQQTLAMLLLMLFTSKGAAGSGFMALVTTLTVMPDIPLAGVALIIGIDRFMLEARGLTSLVSNAVATVVVSLWESACDRQILRDKLARGFVPEDIAAGGGDR